MYVLQQKIEAERTEKNAKTITLGRYDFDTETGVESEYTGDYIEENVIDKSKVRIFAFLNVSRRGMLDLEGENDVSNLDPQLTASYIKSFSDETVLKDSADTPEEAQIKHLVCESIREVIKELPAQYAVCLDMYFFYDVSHAEISKITGLPVNTIKSLIFRAKKILKDKLIERGLI